MPWTQEHRANMRNLRGHASLGMSISRTRSLLSIKVFRPRPKNCICIDSPGPARQRHPHKMLGAWSQHPVAADRPELCTYKKVARSTDPDTGRTPNGNHRNHGHEWLLTWSTELKIGANPAELVPWFPGARNGRKARQPLGLGATQPLEKFFSR